LNKKDGNSIVCSSEAEEKNLAIVFDARLKTHMEKEEKKGMR